MHRIASLPCIVSKSGGIKQNALHLIVFVLPKRVNWQKRFYGFKEMKKISGLESVALY